MQPDSSSSSINPPGRVGLSLALDPLVSLSPPSPLASLVHPLKPSLDIPPIEPVHHIALVRQGRQPEQRQGRCIESDFTPLGELLSVLFSQFASFLGHADARPLPGPLPRWHDVNAYCLYHRAVGHSTDDYCALLNIVWELIDLESLVFDPITLDSVPSPTDPLGSIGLVPAPLAVPHPEVPISSVQSGRLCKDKRICGQTRQGSASNTKAGPVPSS